MAELTTYTNGDNDQPTVCPMCSSRTFFKELPDGTQKHLYQDPQCRYKFIVQK